MVDAAAKVAERLLTAAIEMTDLMAVAVGDRLGYYRLLNERGPLCSPELAAATGTPERYAREWLEQQAVTGLLEVQNETLPPSARRFRLADGVAQVLATPDDLSFLAPLARQMVAAAAQVPAVVQAVRAGRGVPWSFYGADMRESEADLTRPAYLHLLATCTCSHRTGCRPCPTFNSACWPIPQPGSPTSGAVAAGPPSRSLRASPRCTSTPSTWMPPRSNWPGTTSRRPA